MSNKILSSTDIEKEFKKRLISGSVYTPSNFNLDYTNAIKVPLDQRIINDQQQNTIEPKTKIVIHATTGGGGNLSSQDSYLLSFCNWRDTRWRGYVNGKSKEIGGNKSSSATHYTVFKDGKIAQHANEEQWLEHVMKNNSTYIGIEHHFSYEKETPTKKMYKASANLVKDICKRRKIDLSDPSLVVVQHDPLADPGIYWDWNYYFKLLKTNEQPDRPPKNKDEIDKMMSIEGKEKVLSFAHPNPEFAPGKVKREKKKPYNEEAPYNNEDIENGILSQFLPEIISHRVSNLKRYPNLIYFDTGEQTPFFNNLLFAKKISSVPNYNRLTNLEISNFVPFVELYLIKGNKNILFPLDDYTNKTKIENIFNDPSNRGGNIGIKKVSWNSLATNNDNLAQFTVKVSFLIQDISEIEQKRNGVSLLDFLYPAGSRDPNVYNAKNHNIKMKAGWKFRQNRTMDFDYYTKIEKIVQDTIYLSLYKHSFEFDERDGTVTLDVEYIGMLETETSNIHEKNVLDESNFITGETSTELKAWKNTLSAYETWLGSSDPKYGPKDTSVNSDHIKGVAKQKDEKIEFIIQAKSFPFFDTTTYNMSVQGDREECREKIKEQIQNLQQTQTKEKAGAFVSLLNSLNQDQKLQSLILLPDQVEFLKNISHSSTVISTQTREALNKQIKNIAENLKGGRSSNVYANSEFNKNTIIKQNFITEDGKLDLSKFEKIQNDGALLVPYVYLQDILHYLYKWIYGAENAKNAETRLCLGSFSYLKSNVISTTNVNEADSTKLSEKIVDKDGKVLRQFSNTRHYANIGDIPISIKSFASWYSNKIIDGDIQKMSFHDLLKEIMYVLVPQNIEPRIFPWGPSVSFDPFIIYETIPKVEEIEKWISTYHTVKQGDLQKSPWVNFSKYKTLKTTKIQEEDSETINYIFLTSKMEVNEKLKGNAKEDINNNIPHFYVGEEKGLIKNIKFKREDNKQLDAANIIKANKEQTTPKIIRQIYQLEMSMFGNTIFYPGNLIHISPSYPGSKLFSKTLYKIGLGGYYRIIRINHNIGSDGFTTNIEAKWETSGIESLNEEQKITEEITEETAQQTAQSTETPEMKQIRELGTTEGTSLAYSSSRIR